MTTNKKEELKACPFCGSSAMVQTKIVLEEMRTQFWICCSKCNASSSELFYSESSAESQWNTRPLEDDLRAERDEAREAFNMIYRIWTETKLSHSERNALGVAIEKWREKVWRDGLTVIGAKKL